MSKSTSRATCRSTNKAVCCVLSSLLLLSMVSCDMFKKKEAPPVVDDGLVTVSFTDYYKLQTSDDQFAAEDMERGAMKAFLLQNGVVRALFSDEITSLLPRTLKIDSGQLFVVFNAQQCADLKTIKIGSTKEQLLAITADQLSNVDCKRVPLSGVATIAAGEKKATVALEHLYARVDLKLENVVTDRMVAQGIETSGYLFGAANKTYSGTLSELSRNFQEPLSEGQKGVAYLFEQKSDKLTFAFNCWVVGKTKKQLIEIEIPSLNIERNSTYQITLSANLLAPDDPIIGKFEQLPWNDEDLDIGSPDLSAKVEIDTKNFTFDTTSVDFQADKRQIRICYRGDTLEIPFTGNFDKMVSVVDGNANFGFATVDGTRYKNDRVRIEVAQPRANRSYTVTLNVKSAFSPLGQGVNYTIKVDPSEPPAVVMGGVEWMAFNYEPNKDFSILDLKQTVRDLYKSNWVDYVNMCEWGERPNPSIFLAPSVENGKPKQNPAGNLLNQAAGLFWINKVPCPAGWRLPSIGEMWQIWPPQGWAINSEVKKYTVSNIEYSAQIEESGAVYQYSGVVQPTKMLVIRQGQNELCFPLAGYRPREDYNNQNDKTPIEVGKSGFYWSNLIGEQTYNARVKGLNNGSSWNSYGGNKFELFGSWNMVRCVRNIQGK